MPFTFLNSFHAFFLFLHYFTCFSFFSFICMQQNPLGSVVSSIFHSSLPHNNPRPTRRKYAEKYTPTHKPAHTSPHTQTHKRECHTWIYTNAHIQHPLYEGNLTPTSSLIHAHRDRRVSRKVTPAHILEYTHAHIAIHSSQTRAHTHVLSNARSNTPRLAHRGRPYTYIHRSFPLYFKLR